MPPEQGKEPEKKAGTEVKEAAGLETTDRMGEGEGSIMVSKIRRDEKTVFGGAHHDISRHTGGYLRAPGLHPQPQLQSRCLTA